MMEDGKIDIDRVFSALGDATRRAMLERLSAAPFSAAMSVSQLAAPFEMTLAAVVQHLQVLEESGLVRTEKVGRVRTCRVDAAGLRAAVEWLEARRPQWERRLDNLDAFLEEAGLDGPGLDGPGLDEREEEPGV
jgi:DNA-binding transcriptional ArsR family regulator